MDLERLKIIRIFSMWMFKEFFREVEGTPEKKAFTFAANAIKSFICALEYVAMLPRLWGKTEKLIQE